ncbi:8-oxo-dGTP diphosphatase [Knoellia remsis]|uniref:8-oxo-dGTP diphosphatase n=1 Tax=Knoellia remsis TaxID=407159 RepID=A0A2T0UJG9_9MICO|nr:NUDIX hydrolase [Knoellia remsis]PRY58052.1 8-oxo-dGTP diphosphatase [Knoellia remsis]
MRRGALEVALVHRPKYDDWSWPKGKLDPGEDWAGAAARETFEETGLEVRLGRPLPEARYLVLTKSGHPADKVVRYWAASVTGGDGRLENEIDAVEWLEVGEAHDRLDYAHDRVQLRALVRAHGDGALETWPLVIVRHAKALARSDWDGDDRKRPLEARGRERADALVPVLTAYGITRILTSPSARCLDTIGPYAVSAGIEPRAKRGLSEEGHDAAPEKAGEHVERLLARGEPAALCTHGPVMAAVMDVLSPLLELTGEGAVEMLERFVEARDENLAKGEALVCHVAGTGEDARIVAVERHLP